MEKKNMPIEKKIFRDVYIFYEKYASREQTDEYWKEVAEEIERITNFYKGCTLCRDLLYSVFFCLESASYSDKAKAIFKDIYMLYEKHRNEIQDDDYLEECLLEAKEKFNSFYEKDILYSALMMNVLPYLKKLRQVK